MDYEQAGVAQPLVTSMLRTNAPTELRPLGETPSLSEGCEFNLDSKVSMESDPEIP